MATHRHRRHRRAKKGKQARRSVVGGIASTSQERLPGHVSAALYLQRVVGNKATAGLLQRQAEEEEGSVTVVGSASQTEEAIDTGSFSTDVAEQRGGDQTPSDEELGETLKKKARQAHLVQTDDGFYTQHPSMAQLGIRPKEIKGKKLAAYIGNDTYKAEEWRELPGAKADARRMKSTMQEHGYETLEHARNQTAPEMEALFEGTVGKAKPGDAMFLYYAGHGIPGGLAGVDSEVEYPGGANGGDGERGLKLVNDSAAGEKDEPKAPYTGYLEGHKLTDIIHYPALMGPIEAGMGKGVHTTFIADACHSGTATDLVRDKAVEKLAKDNGNKKVKAVADQIKRLNDMKAQIPAESAISQPEDNRGQKLVGGEPIPLGKEQKPVAQRYWEKVVHPELKMVGAYLKGAGLDMTVPEKPGSYTKEGIEQQINAFVNQLVDLGEAIEKEGEESVLAIAP